MRIGFCYNVKRETQGGLSAQLDYDDPRTIERLTQIIESLGHTVEKIEADENIVEKLKAKKKEIDLVFNIAEGLYGDARESWVPWACELAKIPYTHSSPTVHALKLDKELAKLAVAGLGVKVPAQYPCEFPVIIKPKAEGSSMGVFNDNLVRNETGLRNKIQDLRNKGLMGELLIEEYIEGRELTVGLLGNGEAVQVLPIIEQKFDFLPVGMNRIAGYELKWMMEDKLEDLTEAYDCPASLDQITNHKLQITSKKIYTGLGVRDCARIDYRMDEKGELYFLEINTLPGINPDETIISYFPIAAKAAGMTMPQLINRIIEEAKKRYTGLA